MRQLLEPIVSKFDELLRLMSIEADANLQVAYATCISQAMGFARYTLRHCLLGTCKSEFFVRIKSNQGVVVYVFNADCHRSCVGLLHAYYRIL